MLGVAHGDDWDEEQRLAPDRRFATLASKGLVHATTRCRLQRRHELASNRE